MKRFKHSTKLISLLLSLVLVIGTLPITAFATEQTQAEPEPNGTVDLPTKPGGKENETVDVIVTVETKDGVTTTTKETPEGGDTTDSGLNVKYEGTEITVVPPTDPIEAPGEVVPTADSADSANPPSTGDSSTDSTLPEGTLIKSDSHYEVTDGKGYHAEGGSESSTVKGEDIDRDGKITVGIIENGEAVDNASGSYVKESETTGTNDGNGNYDQTTVSKGSTATAEVTDPTITVGNPTNEENTRPDAGYTYFVDDYWSINNKREGSLYVDNANFIYWEILDKDGNPTDKNILNSDKIKDNAQWGGYVVSSAGLYNIVLGKEDNSSEKIGGLYCVDWNTDTADGKGYTVVNLEDAVKNGYYTEEQAKHLRAIINKGYDWSVGSGEKDADGNDAPGTASLADFKALMNQALRDGKFDNSGVSQEDMYKAINGDDTGNGGLRREDAATITQIALWSYANRISLEDGETLDVTVYDTAKKDTNIAYTAMMKYLASLSDDGKKDETQIISEDRFIDNMDIVIGSMVKDDDGDDTNDVYNVDLKFSLKVTPSAKNDDLIVKVVDDAGNTLKTVRIAGEKKDGEEFITADEETGYYTLTGLHLQEGSNTTFNLKLEGYQQLTEGVYVFQSRIENGKSTSQNLIGKYEGKAEIDLNMQFDITFNVEEGTVTTTREWRKEWNDSTPGGGDDDDDDNGGDPKVSVKGEKKWVYDENDDTVKSLIPEEIIVKLLADGKEIKEQTVKADKNGNWKYSFTNLPKYENHVEIEYTVEEVEVKGFTATYDGYNITNTYTGDEESKKPEDEKPGDDDDDNIPDGGTPGSNVPDRYDDIPDGTPLGSVPKTGDVSGLWLALTALCGLGLLAVIVFGKKREYDI